MSTIEKTAVPVVVHESEDTKAEALPQVAVVVGVGPGLGGALARRFADADWRVVCVARRAEVVAALAGEVHGVGMTCDVTDETQIKALFQRIRDEVGPVHTLLWNVGSGVWGDIDNVEVAALDLALATNARGLFLAAQEVANDMRAAGGGNIIITGATASLRGKPATTAFAAGKAAQRSLAESLARTLWPQGVHVALIIVDGMVDLPVMRERFPDRPHEDWLSPDGYADAALFLCRQRRGAWTFQLEVRPNVEPW